MTEGGTSAGAPATPGEGAPRPTRRLVVGGLVAAAALGEAACTPTTGVAPDAAVTGAPSTAPGTGAGSAAPTSASPTGTTTTSATGAPTARVLTVPGGDIATGPTSEPLVALTFHGAGDVGLTRQVMALAASAGAGLTVFAVGQWLDANPDVGRALVAAGHDLGNHTWSHQEMPRLTLAQATTEVQRGADAVRRAVGASGLLFRPSGTPTSTATIRSAAATAGYNRCVGYDVDPEDYTDPGADLVRTRTLAAVHPGAMVSLHLGHAGTVAALPGILDGLQQRGLRPVTLTRLLQGAS